MVSVNLMKEWQVTLGGAFVMFVAALGMFLWSNSIDNPVSYYEYMIISNQYFMTFLAGVLFVGVGGGCLICTLLVYQLEKKIETLEQNRHAASQEKS
jgi:uncharacterized membrane protein YciS (DUF1049 family)